MLAESDIFQSYSGTHELTAFVRELVIPYPEANGKLLRDVSLRFHCSPSFPVALSANDLRIYLDATDVTEATLAVLRAQIDRIPDKGRSAYSKALDKWVLLEDTMGDVYPAGSEMALLAALKQPNVSNLLTQLGQYLGEHNFGHGGNLHPVNFLFSQIPIAPLSLVEIIHTYNQSSTLAARLDVAQVARITFSLGPCRLYEEAWHPAVRPLGSILTYWIDWQYVNSLDDPIQDILHTVGPRGIIQAKILELEDKADLSNNTLSDIDLNVGPTGIIQVTLLPDIDTELRKLSARVETCNTNLGDTHNIVAIQSAEDELRNNFGQ